MQSPSARRRVESGGRVDEGFWVRLEVDECCRIVCGGDGWLRAGFDERAEEEAGNVEECFCEEQGGVEQELAGEGSGAPGCGSWNARSDRSRSDKSWNCGARSCGEEDECEGQVANQGKAEAS